MSLIFKSPSPSLWVYQDYSSCNCFEEPGTYSTWCEILRLKVESSKVCLHMFCFRIICKLPPKANPKPSSVTNVFFTVCSHLKLYVGWNTVNNVIRWFLGNVEWIIFFSSYCMSVFLYFVCFTRSYFSTGSRHWVHANWDGSHWGT